MANVPTVIYGTIRLSTYGTEEMGLVPKSDLIDKATPCPIIKIPSTSNRILKPNLSFSTNIY